MNNSIFYTIIWSKLSTPFQIQLHPLPRARRAPTSPGQGHRGAARPRAPAPAPAHSPIPRPRGRVLHRRRMSLPARRTTHEADGSGDGNHPHEKETQVQEWNYGEGCRWVVLGVVVVCVWGGGWIGQGVVGGEKIILTKGFVWLIESRFSRDDSVMFLQQSSYPERVTV